MADIDFLSSAGKGEEDKKAGGKPADEDMQMHVPDPLQKEVEDKPKKALFKEEEEKGGGDLLHPKEPEVRVEPPKPKAVPAPPPPKPVIPPPAKPTPPPPKPPPPKPPAPPKPPKPEPAKEPEKGGSTLRVSLLGGEGGTVMTDLTLRSRMRTFVVVIILSLVVNGLIYGGILFYKSRVISNVQEITQGLEGLDSQIREAEKKVKPAQEFQKLTGLGEELLDNHVRWTRFLALLESLVLTDVQLLNLTGVESGNVTADMVARDFSTIGRQILALEENPDVASAEISAATAQYGESGLLLGANAGLSVRFNPEAVLLGAEQEESETENVN